MSLSARVRRAVALVAAPAAVAAALVLPGAAGPAAAVPPSGTAVTDDRATSVPTSWRWYTGASANFLNTGAQQGGYRIVDLEVQASTPVFTARLVRNAGSYAAPGGWWWYYGKTLAQVNTLLGTNKARLIDIEGYATSAGQRYAVVMVRNTGTAYRNWYYRINTNVQAMYNEMKQKGYRPQQVGSMRIGSTVYRTLIAIRNTGSDARTWWWYLNRTHAQVGSLLGTNKARLVNLERVTSAPGYDVLMIREPTSFWLWYTGLTSAQVTAGSLQAGTRLIDVEPYATSAGTRYAVVLLDNLWTVDGKARNAMWARYGSFTQWGFYFKRVQGSTLNNLYGTRQFEPASAIKALIHFHVNLKLQQGGVASVNENLSYKRQNRADWWNSCPDSSTINGTAKLGAMDTGMMMQSNNPYTHSLRQRFGTASIEATGHSIGMTGTAFHHNLGCGTFLTNPNRTTLADLGRIYDRVQAGSPLTSTYRTRFLNTMLNQSNSGAEDGFCAVAKQEGASLGMSATWVANTYCKALRTYTKGGSYGDGNRNKWFTNAGLLVLPIKGGSVRSFVYGDYMQKVQARVGEKDETVWAPLAKAAQELARPQIRAALATY